MARQNAAGPHVGFCVFCGLLLLLGFFVPIAEPDFGGDGLEMTFINIEGLQDVTVPDSAKFLLAYPAVAAIGAFILIGVRNILARSITFLVLGLVPIIFIMVNDDGRAMVEALVNNSMSLDDIDWRIVLSLVAWLGILAAGFGGKLHPAGLFPLIAGVTGGVAFLLVQLVPVEVGFENVVPAAMPFEALSEGDLGTAGTTSVILMIAKLGLAATAAILAFFQFMPGEGKWIRYRLMTVFWTLSTISIMLLPVILLAVDLPEEGGGMMFASVALATTKMIALFLPFYLMIPYGVGGIGVMNADWEAESAQRSRRARESVHVGSRSHAAPAAVSPSLGTEERLAELQRLYDNGLITHDEMAIKRQDILDSL